MAVLARIVRGIKSEFYFITCYGNDKYNIARQYTKPAKELADTSQKDVEEFRVLQIKSLEDDSFKKKPMKVIKMPPPRSKKMKFDQDWTHVWPGPKTFHPATVPLPLRQGCMKNDKPPPEKFANFELMKIPNFLHLTDKAIKKHCEALKKFCTKFPEPLESEELQEKYFPLNIIYSDYCHSSPTIRDPLARIVSLKVKLKFLNLNKHAKDKFLRLVGDRYNPLTDDVTITTDSCPFKGQNYEYAQYLLTALYYESCKFEEWEKEKGDQDMENYVFKKRQSFKNVKKVFDYNNRDMPDLKEYATAVQNWHDFGDKPEIISAYKKACLRLLNLPAID